MDLQTQELNNFENLAHTTNLVNHLFHDMQFHKLNIKKYGHGTYITYRVLEVMKCKDVCNGRYLLLV